jgi:hypothetical protein
MLIAIDFARLPGQIQHDMHAPQRITVRLGDDFNWWIDSTDEDEPTPHARGVLDPRQVAHIVETLDEYRPYGYRPSPPPFKPTGSTPKSPKASCAWRPPTISATKPSPCR